MRARMRLSVRRGPLTVQAQEQGIADGPNMLEFTRDGTTAFYGNFFFWVNYFLSRVITHFLIFLELRSFLACNKSFRFFNRLISNI